MRHPLKFALAMIVGWNLVPLGLTQWPVAPAWAAEATAQSAKGMVVADSPVAADVGAATLKAGGNAVDAAVATAFALAVTWPEAGNLGGGGFMMVLPAPGALPVCVEYRETAPLAAARESFVQETDRFGMKTVGVPGTVRGLWLAHREFGRLPWQQLVRPAQSLASEGFEIDRALAASLNRALGQSADKPELQRVFATPVKFRKWRAGDKLIQPDLGRTLGLIADQGPDAFYRGEIAALILREMQQGGGLIEAADLENYRAHLRQPTHGTYRGHDIWGPPPPSSGGICLVQMLHVLEPFQLREHGRYAPLTMHVMAETMRRAFADRARHLGDGDFVPIPNWLTEQAYAKRIGQSIDTAHATPSQALAEDISILPEGEHTTHFSVIDENGMAVANTYTLEQDFGSRIVVRGAGFLLNNEMGDFNWQPGLTTTDGTIGTEPNTVAPGKRMLSSQTPTLVTKDGRAVLITGSPGGRTIINTTLQVVMGTLEFEQPLLEAVEGPRFHHGWFPDVLMLETRENASPWPDSALRAFGHRLKISQSPQGSANSIWIDSAGIRTGVGDSRHSAAAASQ